MDEATTRRLLDELCVDLGLCLAPAELEALAADPPGDAVAFTEAVLAAEGLDPDAVPRRLFRQVRDRVLAAQRRTTEGPDPRLISPSTTDDFPKASGRATLDVSGLTTSDELHDLLASRLAFPGYYGRNWDAFWDCITDPEQSVMPATLCIRGWKELRQRLPRDAQLFRSCLADLAGERDDVRVEWSD